MNLAQVIAARLADRIAHVDLAIHGTDDPQRIAAAIDAVCREALGSGVVEGLFYAVSVGAVAGVVLADGRRVVVKGYQPEAPPELLREIVRVRNHLRENGIAAPAVLAGPMPFGRGHATIESFLDAGRIEDTRKPPFRRALAGGFTTSSKPEDHSQSTRRCSPGGNCGRAAGSGARRPPGPSTSRRPRPAPSTSTTSRAQRRPWSEGASRRATS
jgi:hypothetical protein